MFSLLSRKNDEALAHRVCECLRRTYRPSLARVSISAHGGVITVRGQVYSYHEKQLCLSLCQRVPGVVRVVDQLQVQTAVAEKALPR